MVQQFIRFQALLSSLKTHGLVTEQMLTGTRWERFATPVGDGFCLSSALDCASKPGWWDLMLMTESEPRERDRFSVRDAERVLKRIARTSRKSSPPGTPERRTPL